ncbi:hypothetical protein [Vibrio sinaloensis]|uniref:hypothetical protein n=1 Tax=Photobacterium sp. (strain ATCC 43367) TaxID=379097 RepID=UPI00068B7C9E|nr:hypothetical protein [Vibrio sinaloensis]
MSKLKKLKGMKGVLILCLLFTFYQNSILEDRFVSTSQIIVKQPDSASTMDPSMALLSGFGVTPTNEDVQIVRLYIESYDIFIKLAEKLNFSEHYNAEGSRVFTRGYLASNNEELYARYRKYVTATIDESLTSVTIETQAFTPEFANKLNEAIIELAEEYVNSIGNKLARRQIDFIEGEHQLIENRLLEKQMEVREFQRRYGLLDAEAEGMALQQIAYTLEAQLTQAKTELFALKRNVSHDSLIIKNKELEVEAIRQQLLFERERLSGNSKNKVSDALSEFSELKLQLELILKSYAASQISLEKSRVEAYRQIKYLVTIQNPTTPVSNKYPSVLYNSILCLVILSMFYFVVKIVITTYKEIS